MKKTIKFKLPVDIALQLFDQFVLPVLYCFIGLIYGLSQRSVKLSCFMQKELLVVSKRTTNVKIYGEIGIMPVLKKIISRAENSFTFLCNGKHIKLSYFMYKVMLCKQESMHMYQFDGLKIRQHITMITMTSL